MEPCIKVNGM
jgi:hypothetical protein